MRTILYYLSKFKYNFFQSRLDKKWHKLYPNNDTCKDGILKYSIYYYSKPKIMFLLKEPADEYYIKRECPKGSYGPYGNSKRFWRHIRMWTYTLTEYFNNKNPTFDGAKKVKEEENTSIAYVNIIKETDNSYSNPSYLEKYIKNPKHKKLILWQLKIVKPDIILCGGTFTFFKEIMNNKIKKIASKAYQYKKIKIIKFYHPSPAKRSLSYENYFKQLLAIIKNY